MFQFKSKSDTLKFLKKKKININNFLSFKKNQILKNKNWINVVKKKFKKKSLILRSSALDEDKISGSNAGKYSSIKIDKINSNNLVFSSSKIINKFKSDHDEIIFQEYLENPHISGVVFTRDINNLAPYFVINYDVSGKTHLITSGKKNLSQKTLIIYRDYKKIPLKFLKLIKICKYLESLLETDSLDIEFAIKNKKVFIFQVRPIFNKRKKISDKNIKSILINIEKKIIKLQKPSPLVEGKTTIFSNMSDWNPAEMIGSTSSTLSISLYEELITDKIWAKQRYNYGYKYIRHCPLMVNFAFSPFIDLRVDLSSFLPKDLPESLQIKVLNYFIKKLKQNPHLHDKIEFDLIPTCNSLHLNKFFKKFLKKNEINIYRNSLINLTNKILNNNINNLFLKDVDKIKLLNNKMNEKKIGTSHPIQNIYYIVQLCKDYGTLPFSGLARTAFISTSILKDLKSINILSEQRLSTFYKNIKSINNEFNIDLNKFFNYKITKKSFLKKYGHLRPNTYSITSLNYREGYKSYFGNYKPSNIFLKKTKFKLSKKEIININKALKIGKINLKASQLFKIAEKSIYYREYAKYIFSKAIDKIFINLVKLGEELNISRSDMQHISIKTILESYNNLSPLKLSKIIKAEILQNKKLFENSKAIKLPDLISSHKDIYCFTHDTSKENFITNEKTSSNTYTIDNKINKINIKKIQNKIIFIKNADPGFDFLFSHKINGLITQYGGVNSHMAIRCMENNIPAAIGVGEKKFAFFSACKKIELDCQYKKIIKLI